MIEMLNSKIIQSSDGGDQAFLNNYFPNLIEAPVFDGNISKVVIFLKKIFYY